MAECENCKQYKKLYEQHKKLWQQYKKLYQLERLQVMRDRVWVDKATDYAVTAMQSNVDVLKTSLKKQGQS